MDGVDTLEFFPVEDPRFRFNGVLVTFPKDGEEELLDLDAGDGLVAFGSVLWVLLSGILVAAVGEAYLLLLLVAPGDILFAWLSSAGVSSSEHSVRSIHSSLFGALLDPLGGCDSCVVALLEAMGSCSGSAFAVGCRSSFVGVSPRRGDAFAGDNALFLPGLSPVLFTLFRL